MFSFLKEGRPEISGRFFDKCQSQISKEARTLHEQTTGQ